MTPRWSARTMTPPSPRGNDGRDEHQRPARRRRTPSAHRLRGDPAGPRGSRRAGLRRGAPHPAGAPQPPAPPGDQARAAPVSPRAQAAPARPRPAPERLGGRDPRPDQAVRAYRRGRRRRFARAARLGLRLPRPERRGQDHADPHPARPDPGQPRHDVAARHPGPGRAEPGPGPGRGDRRRAPLPLAPDRPGQPAPAGRGPRGRRGPADRPVAGPGRPGRPRRGQGRDLLDGPTPNCSCWTSR